MVEDEELKRSILSVLGDQGLTFEEIVQRLSWSGDRRPLRKALADLVRDGRVLRVPDYQRRRMVFVLRRP